MGTAARPVNVSRKVKQTVNVHVSKIYSMSLRYPIYIFIFTGDPNKSFLYIFSLTMKLFKIFTDDKNKNNTSQTGQKGQEKMNNENTTQNTGSGTPGGGSGAQGPFGGAAGSESGTSINRCSQDLT